MAGGEHAKVLGVDEGPFVPAIRIGSTVPFRDTGGVGVSPWAVTVRAFGELQGLIGVIVDGKLLRMRIVDYNRIATAAVAS